MAERDVKRVDVRRVDEEAIIRDIEQYQVLLDNLVKRQTYLEQRGAPAWMINRCSGDRDEIADAVDRLNLKLNKIRQERRIEENV